MSMTPHDNTKSPQEPSRGKAASEWGYFYILGEVIGFALLLFVGVRFLVSAERPDVVAWVLLAIAALILVDVGRRILRASRINRHVAE